MSGEECKAFCLLAQEACREISVSDSHLAVICYGSRDAECLESFSDGLCSLGSSLHAFLDGDGSSDNISPLRILEADSLCFFAHLVRIDTLGGADSLGLVYVLDTVFCKSGIDLINSTLVIFKKCHSQLLFTRVNIFYGFCETSVCAFGFLTCFRACGS